MGVSGSRSSVFVSEFISRAWRPCTDELLLTVACIFPGTLLLPIGLLIMGWGAQKHTHWIVPDIVRSWDVLPPMISHTDSFTPSRA